MNLKAVTLALTAVAISIHSQAQELAARSRETSGAFVSDVHYRVLESQVPVRVRAGVVEIVEVFWYGCPHCLELEPGLLAWESEHADRVEVVRVPAMFKEARFHAQAFYTAQVLGKEEQMHAAFFDEIQRNGNDLGTKDELEEFFGRFGIAPAQFRQAFESDAVKTKLQHAFSLARSYRMTFVPWIVINGKYVTDPRSAGGNRELLGLMSELTAHELAIADQGSGDARDRATRP